MADECDLAAEYQQAELDHVLAVHARRQYTPTQTNCVVCDVALNDARKAIAARRCVECQQDFETKARHFAR